MDPRDNELVKNFFEEIVFGFIFNDIERAIKYAKANFLVALGLSVYTEFMGGLVTGNLRERGEAEENYEAFLKRLGPHYEQLDREMENREGKDLFKIVRCGLVHEYFIKKAAIVAVRTEPLDAPGIYYDEEKNVLVFAVENYFRDFKQAVKRYYQELMNGNKELLENFKRAILSPAR